MSDLYRCDHCKKIYEPPAAMECEWLGEVPVHGEPNTYHLCWDCSWAFREWLNESDTKEADNA
jgi:DNA-directed RNA polymerase subunit RPC12/RpoP